MFREFHQLTAPLHTPLLLVSTEGHIADCNAALARRLGYEPEQLYGQPLTHISPLDTRSLLQALQPARQHPDPMPLHLALRTATGHVLPDTVQGFHYRSADANARAHLVLLLQPAAPGPAPQQPLPRQSDLHGQASNLFDGLHALTVEPDSLRRYVLGTSLTELGFKVDQAASDREALACMQAASCHYDLVLLDLQTADSGSAARLQQQLQQTRLPLVTIGAPKPSTAAQPIPDAVLIEPFSLEQLQAVLHRAIPGVHDAPDSGEEAVDVAAALRRLGGDRTTYCRLARQFLQEIEPQRAELHRLLLAHDRVASETLLHYLHNSALILGAAALGDVLNRAEREVREAPEPNWRELDRRLAQHLTRTQVAVHARLAPLQRPENTDAAGHSHSGGHTRNG